MTTDSPRLPAQNDPVGTVLLVDDDPDMLKLMSTWLRGAGFSIQTAGSGSDA
jgi:CheY-like chemotaxis protein